MDNETVSKFLRYIGNVVLVGGIIAAFWLAYQFGETVRISGSYSTRIERDWAVTIGIFLGVLLGEILTAMLIYAVACHLENQSQIIAYLGKINDNAQPSDKEDSKNAKSSLSNSGFRWESSSLGSSRGSSKAPASWKCPKCGKMNPGYTGTCSCGQSKYDA